MKQKDIALIIVIVAVSGVVAFFASNLIIGSPKNKQQVEVVEAISAQFDSPNEKYFNGNSKNFTQTITIGDNPNPDPFKD